MFVLHAGILAFNLGYEFDFTLLILGSVAVLFYGVGALSSPARSQLVRRHPHAVDAQ